MAKIRLLRSRTVQELKANIAANLERYRSGNFDFLESDSSSFFEAKLDANDSAFGEVYGDKEDHREVECCAAIYEAMGALPPYLARDDRLWTYLTHTTLLEYARKRWPIFERTKFRGLMKQLNLRGGVKLLGALDSEQIESIVEECSK